MTKPVPDESENPFDAIQEGAEDIPDRGDCADYGIPEGDELQVYDWDALERSQNIDLKGRFATHVIWITYGWMFMVIGSVITTGICAIYGREFLSDAGKAVPGPGAGSGCRIPKFRHALAGTSRGPRLRRRRSHGGSQFHTGIMRRAESGHEAVPGISRPSRAALRSDLNHVVNVKRPIVSCFRRGNHVSMRQGSARLAE